MSNAPARLTEIPFGLSGRIYRCSIPSSPRDPLFAEAWDASIGAVVVLEERRRWATKLDAHYDERGWSVLYVPVPDGTAPPLDEAALPAAVAEVAEYARQGRNVLVHCWAGHGRTGMFLACLARLLRGLAAPQAIAWVRQFVPEAVEDPSQEDYVHDVVLEPRTQDSDIFAIAGVTDAERTIVRAIAGGKRKLLSARRAHGDLRRLVALAAAGKLRKGGHFGWRAGSWLDQSLRVHLERCVGLAGVTLFDAMRERPLDDSAWERIAESMLVGPGLDGLTAEAGAPDALVEACSGRRARNEVNSRSPRIEIAKGTGMGERWAAYLAAPEHARSFAKYVGARCSNADRELLRRLMQALEPTRRSVILSLMRQSSHPFWKRFAASFAAGPPG